MDGWKPPTLETERLVLRAMTLADAEDMFTYASDPDVARYVTWSAHCTLEDSLGFLRFVEQRYAAGDAYDWGLILKETNRLIGTCGYVNWLKNHHVGEIGYALGSAYWGKGLVTEAARRVIEFGFNEMGLNRIEARCKPINIGSERVMQKIGMHFEGVARQKMFVKGEYHDLKQYAVLKDDWQ